MHVRTLLYYKMANVPPAESNGINPLLGPGDAPDQILAFPPSVRPPFPCPPGVPLTPPAGSISPGGGPLPPHPLGGMSPLLSRPPPPHPPLPGIPPGLVRPPPLDAPPPGLPPMMPPPSFPIPPSSQPAGPPLLTPPPVVSSSSGPSQMQNIEEPLISSQLSSGGEQLSNPPGTEDAEEEQEVWVEHKTADGSIYYSDPKTRKTTWEKPKDVKIVPYTPPTAPTHSEGPGLPPGVVPSSSIPGLPPGIPLIPQRVWSEHENPDGRIYFYNKVTRQSVWEKPKDLELVMPLPADLAGLQRSTPSSSDSNLGTMKQDDPNNPSQNETPVSVQVTPSLIRPQMPHIPPSLLSSGPSSSDKALDEEPEMDSKELLALVASKLGTGPPQATPTPKVINTKAEEESKGPKPTLSVPVPGTPWSVVYTNDEKMFFFDATSRKSFWDIPPELENNPQVYKIVENPPWKKKRVGAVEEPASKRIKIEDDDGDSMREDQEEEEVMEVEGGATEGLPTASGDKSQESTATSREAKMAEMRANIPQEERQDMFKAMLLERQVSAFSTWDKELPKFVFDDRFHLLLPKERKIAFDEFIQARAEEEMKEKKQKLKEKKEVFIRLLHEAKITKKTTFSEFCRTYGKDERFKSIEKMKEREALFQERISELKKINRQKEEEQRQTQRTRAERVKSDFFSMLEEATRLTPNSQWKKVKSIFQKDDRYQAIDSSSLREEYFEEYVKQLGKDEKQERVEASLREREREVQMSRTAQQEQWEKERDQLRRTEAETIFNALLVDLVKDPTATWTSAKKNLRRDHRWEMCDTIDSGDKESLFKEHIGQLEEKRRLHFRNLLEETSKITLKMPWKKARKLIKEDPRYKKYSDSDDRRESEYERYLRDKLVQSKNEFKSLLKETKLINYKTKRIIRESDKHLKDIIDTLEKDQRYLVLDCIRNEREDILMDYIDSLHRRGPPPPPTATHPSERLRK